MTVTTRDIVKGAFRHLGLVDGEAEPTAAEMSEGITALNDMIASWAKKGVSTGIDELGENDDFPFEAGHFAGIKALLAIYLAGEYGKSPADDLRVKAVDGWQALQADYGVLEELRVDTGLQYLPSQRPGWD